MTRHRGKAAAAALAAAAIAIAPPFVSLPVARGAVDYTWNSGNSGSYSDGTKWTPAGPPGVADNAIFSNPLAPAYTVTVPAAQHANAVQVSGDTLTLNLSGGTTTLDSASPAALLVQNNGATHSQLTITGGNLSIPNGGITITDTAQASGATFNGVIASANSLNLSPYGQLSVTGGQLSLPSLTLNAHAFFLVDGGGKFTTLLPASGGGFTYGDVTLNGTPADISFYAQSGGKLIVGGNLIVSSSPTSTYGYASVFDSGSLLQVGDPLSGHQSDFIIGQAGHGVSYMRSGSHTVLTRDLYVAQLPNSSGLALMGGSTVDISRNMLVGQDPTIPVPGGSTPARGFVSHDGGQVTNIGGQLKIFPNGEITHEQGSIFNVTGGVQLFGKLTGRRATINASVTNAGDLYAESDTLGHLVITGPYTQTSSGHVHETLTRGSPTVLLDVNGPSVQLDGFFDLNFTNPGAVQVGDQFQLLRTSAPITGSATITFPGFTFSPLISPGNGFFAVVQSVPEPVLTTLPLLAALSLRGRRWR